MSKDDMNNALNDNSENYMEIYKKNHFKIGDIIFSFEDIPEDKLFTKRFAILTAWNPNNVRIDDETNAKNNELLINELRHMNLLFESALGYLGDHQEASYCIYDISLSDAIKLGKKFQQYSIFYNDTTSVGYYHVDTSEAILVKNI